MVATLDDLEVEQISAMILMVDLYGKSEITRNVCGFATNHDFSVSLALGCDPILYLVHGDNVDQISDVLKGSGVFPLVQRLNRVAYRKLGNMYREVDFPLGIILIK